MKNLANECARKMEEVKSLKDIVRVYGIVQSFLFCGLSKCILAVDFLEVNMQTEKMQEDKQELEIFLDMLGQQIYDNR